MTIIDQYILENRDKMNVRDMATSLGVSDDFVRSRKSRLSSKPDAPLVRITAEQEMYALVQFILERKTGLLVEIAERRIIDINNALKY